MAEPPTAVPWKSSESKETKAMKLNATQLRSLYAAMILLLLAAVLFLAACSSGADDDGGSDGPATIIVSTQIDAGAPTRVSGSGVQSTNFEQGETFYVTMTNTDQSSAVFTTTDESGHTATASMPEFGEGSQATLRGYYPYGTFTVARTGSNTTATVQVTASTNTFTVQPDQSEVGAYKASDLMVSNQVTVNKPGSGSANAALTFAHKLSKIIVEVQSDGFTGKGMTIRLNNVATTTPLTAGTGAPTGTPGNRRTVEMGAALLREDAQSRVAAIIPPQTIAAGTTLLTFAIDGMGTISYAPTAIVTFATGCVYTYTLKFHKGTELTVTATLTAPGAFDTTSWKSEDGSAEWTLTQTGSTLGQYTGGTAW